MIIFSKYVYTLQVIFKFCWSKVWCGTQIGIDKICMSLLTMFAICIYLLQLMKVLAQFSDNRQEFNGKILTKTILWFGVETQQMQAF